MIKGLGITSALPTLSNCKAVSGNSHEAAHYRESEKDDRGMEYLRYEVWQGRLLVDAAKGAMYLFSTWSEQWLA